MHAIYVLENGSQVGPFSPDDIRRAVAENRMTLSQLGWHEGCESWKPLAEILEGLKSSEEDLPVVAEGPGFVLTREALRIREEIFPLDLVAKSTVEVEHTRRGRYLVWTIVFGFLVVVALAMPYKPESTKQWIIWGICLAAFLLLTLRFALLAFRPSPTFLAVELTNSDERILPMSRREAEAAKNAIEKALADWRASQMASSGGEAQPSET